MRPSSEARNVHRATCDCFPVSNGAEDRRYILDPAVVESIIRRPLLTHYQLPLRQRQE